jgi:hypothetical protein
MPSADLTARTRRLLPGALRRSKLTQRVATASALERDLAIMVAAFAFLRAVAVVGRGSLRYSDSGTYEPLNFLGGAVRLPTIPALYALLPTDGLRVAGQLLIGIACWSTLAVVVAHSVRHPAVARVGAAAVLILGLTLQVAGWDMVILSESIGVSMAVLLVAAVLNVSRQPTPRSLTLLLIALTLWACARHVNVILLLVLLPFALVVIFRRLPRRSALATGAALLVLAAWGVVALSRENAIWRLNSFTVIAQRIQRDPEALAFFEERGLRVTPELRKELEGPRGNASPAFHDPQMQTFLKDKWRGAYLSYLVRHPVGTVRQPLEDASPLFSSDAALTKPRPVLPGPVQDVAFGREPGDIPLLFALAVGLWLAAWARVRRVTAIDAAAAALLVSSVVWLGLVWHLSADELQRLTVPVAVTFRIALLVLLLLGVDRLLLRRSDDRSGGFSPRSTHES